MTADSFSASPLPLSRHQPSLRCRLSGRFRICSARKASCWELHTFSYPLGACVVPSVSRAKRNWGWGGVACGSAERQYNPEGTRAGEGGWGGSVGRGGTCSQLSPIRAQRPSCGTGRPPVCDRTGEFAVPSVRTGCGRWVNTKPVYHMVLNCCKRCLQS